MHLSSSTKELLTALGRFSGEKLSRQGDLGVFIELATSPEQKQILEDLSFFAKFASRVYRIIQRIGPEGEGYDKLQQQFTETLKKSIALARRLLDEAPHSTRVRFEETYFRMSPEAVGHLLSLLYDLSWYKNWLIDNERESARH